jgi:hypothetical protein
LDLDETKDYLDRMIRYWRKRFEAAETADDILTARCYIDAFQSVRISVFGELLPPEGGALNGL